jgi:hypothetical protein
MRFCDILQAQNSTIRDWLTDSTGAPQITHKLPPIPLVKMLISCGQIHVANPQRGLRCVEVSMQIGVFAYNELPTYAVAIACWFRARQRMTRPFFLALSL